MAANASTILGGYEMPCILNCPLREGRKPTSIPDTTQFAGVIQHLFGVTCATPEEAFRLGTYNELYLLHLNVPDHLRGTVPAKVLARVSRDDKTRSDISLESEIATMTFIRSRTNIPVPIVYGYCPTRDNAIGQPFSILSFTEGADVNSSFWENLPLETKLSTIRDYAHIILELSKLKFDCIGSIYFKRGGGGSAIVSPPHCHYELGPVTWCKHESAARKKHCRYDRGPWKSSVGWLWAALSDEIDFMGVLPELAQSTYKFRTDGGVRWRLAEKVLPMLRDRVVDTIEDPLDRYATGPFVLAHMDFNPWNIIIATEGPNTGRIISVIDWEMSMTVPLWALVCYPSWFGRIGPFGRRDHQETQLFKDTYIRELQRHTKDPFILNVVQNARAESKRYFADCAVLPWPMVDSMVAWMELHPKRV